jgi:mono/diheme cytochrome c family protein
MLFLTESEFSSQTNFQETIMRVRSAACISHVMIMAFIVLTVVFMFADFAQTDENQAAGPAGVGATQQNTGAPNFVTPAHGPSWLKYLGIFNIRFTAMGEMGGHEPPPSSPREEPRFPVGGSPPSGPMGMGMGGMMGGAYSNYRFSPDELERMMSEKFLLAGVDLYRLNCRSCHGPNGDGSPPEIKALIGPVQGTSPSLIEERMKKMGRPIGRELAKELAAQADESIRQRLQKGGKRMPPFWHLDSEEVDALMQYLQQHVGAPESRGKEILVTQSVARVGEHLVKGTCQICHDATGPGRGPMMGMMQGIIPSLASFPYEQSMQSMVWQVAWGSRPMMMGGQRMPAYPYITSDEAAASYLYLMGYPPYY